MPVAGPDTAGLDAAVLQPLPQIITLRDFMAFEQHVANARARRGEGVPDAWYKGPTFYYGNAFNIVGDGAPIARPAWTQKLDFELELGCVIGLGGRNIAAADAERHIAGLTIVNDWSARDVQRREMQVGLGPSKSKEFATSVGPGMVPLSHLAERWVSAGRWDLPMRARVNGVQVSSGSAADMRWSFAELIEHASRDCDLRPGELIASGTVGGGCLLELGSEVHDWLQPGDVVELQVDGIGVLRNTIVDPPAG